MLAVLAKLGSTTMVGYFALGLAVTAPVYMLTNLNLRGIQSTDARREYQFGHYLGLRLLAIPLAFLIIVGVVVVSGYSRESAAVILVVGVAKAFESVSDVFYGLLQQHERMDRIAISMIAKGILSLAALGAGVYATHNVLWGALGLAIVWALLLVGYDMRNGALMLRRSTRAAPIGPQGPLAGLRALHPLWERALLKRLVYLTLPIGIVMMVGSLSVNIPRYAIERYLGSSELGIFAAMSYVLVAGTTVTSALGQAASPRLSQYFAAGRRSAFRSLLLRLLGVGAVLGSSGMLIGIVAGHTILTLLYRPEYAHYLNVFVWLLVAAGFSYVASFLGYGLTSARYLKIQVPISGAVVVCMATGSILLIPRYGMIAAAWVACGAYALNVTLAGAVLVYALTRRPNIRS